MDLAYESDKPVKDIFIQSNGRTLHLICNDPVKKGSMYIARSVEFKDSKGRKDVISDHMVSFVNSGKIANDDIRGLKAFPTEYSNSGRTVYLTGKPISKGMEHLLDRCAKGEDVSAKAFDRTIEIRHGYNTILKGTPTNELPGRESIRKDAINRSLSVGSAKIDSNGDVSYNGRVRTEKRLDIIIGLPASGKSTAIINNLSRENGSMLVDNDEIKKLLPEFNNGWGGDLIHEESVDIEKEVLKECFKSGRNVVIPKVGSESASLIKSIIKPAKDAGYKVNVHFVELDKNRALGRCMNRFIDTGKWQKPSLIDKYVDENGKSRIETAYEQLKQSGYVSGFSRWDNNVAYGEKPILKESYGLTDSFIRNARIELPRKDDHDMDRNDYEGEER